MKKMSEVFKGEVKVTGRYLTSDSAHAAFSDTPTAQHAAHAINHVDALADALAELIKLVDDKEDVDMFRNSAYKESVQALAAYRGGK